MTTRPAAVELPTAVPDEHARAPHGGLAKVTVVVPNYNHARFLPRRIESILGQTYQDFEVVLLDDGSSDDSCLILDQFAADRRIKILRNRVNTGVPARQWNRGVREANGTYVWIAESDDFADNEFLDVMVARLDEHPNVGLAFCQSWEIDGDDNVLRSFASHTEDLDATRWRREFIDDGRRECSRYLLYRNTIPNASAVLFRKDVYVAAGYADESLRHGHDQLMWAKMLLRSDLLFVPQPHNYFRRHAGAFGTSDPLRPADAVTFFEKLAEALAQSPQARADRRLTAQRHYLRGRQALCRGDRRLARRYFSRSLRVRPLAIPLVCWVSTFFGPRFRRAAWKIHDGAPWILRMLGKLGSL